MTFITFLIIWYIVGVVSSIIGVIIHDGQLTVGDCIVSITFGWLGGLVVLIIMGCMLSPKVIWRKK